MRLDRIVAVWHALVYSTPTPEVTPMRGAVSIIYMARNSEYQVPVFNIDQPDPNVVAEREERIIKLKEQMGARYILHPGYVRPSANEGKLL